jgi:asparagine synthase (glutamine-hydrolysing)
MSGICGFTGVRDETLLLRMAACLRHRGPNGSGAYYADGVSLGHCRSSVIDLANGRQPMSNNEDGSVTVVLDGLIYNYRELRYLLESRGHVFRTRSDTEVLLRCFEEEGEQALQRLRGMFAFAVHDRQKGELFLARDRVGVRPLYYLDLPDRFMFASELKALLANPDWTPTIDTQAVQDYLALGYIPGSSGIIADVKRLEPGHFLVVRDSHVRTQRYWELPDYDGPYYKKEEVYLEELDELMELSVSRRMISDVPVGAHLGADLESNMIVALMSRFSSAPIKTFSVAVESSDSSSDTEKTANVLGCDHKEITYGAADVARLPEIVYHMDDPFGDPLSIPQYKFAQEVRKNVSVILKADGGNEIFGGSSVHKLMWVADTYRRSVPLSVRNQFFAPILSAMPASVFNAVLHYPAHLGSKGKSKTLNYLDMLEPDQINQAYRYLISNSYVIDSENVFTERVQAQLKSNGAFSGATALPVDIPFLNRLLVLQFRHWLPNNLLLRLDNLFMGHGLEHRLPFLDHELVEFVMRLPQELRIHNLTDKYLLRSYSKICLPTAMSKPKRKPVVIAVEQFADQPAFRSMMNDLLSDFSTLRRGLFRVDAVAKMRDSVNRNELTHGRQVFSLMVLELWLRTFVDGAKRRW